MFIATIKETELSLQSKPDLFSPTAVDSGTRLMLDQITFTAEDKVLDLGCGYGAIGLYVAKLIGVGHVVMSDINPVAVSCARRNAQANDLSNIPIITSDGFNDMKHSAFTKIISHPPYHSDFDVAKHFIEKGFNRLVVGGCMYMVTKRELWYKNKFTSIFGGVKIVNCGAYFIFIAEKRSATYAPKAPKNKGSKKSRNKRERPPRTEETPTALNDE